jgi:hypothetical protein
MNSPLLAANFVRKRESVARCREEKQWVNHREQRETVENFVRGETSGNGSNGKNLKAIT